jgi:diguanylate cyclase (GGDEF)-like protein/PAS domain S-box-containing protein
MRKPTRKDPGKSTGKSDENPLKHRTLEELHRSIVESTSDSIYMVDRDSRYRFINKPHLLRLGMPVEKIISNPYGDFHTLDQTREFSKIIEEVFATGESIQHNYRSLRDNRYFVRTLSPLKEKEPDGKIVGVVVVSKDITEMKQVEEALRESEGKYKTIIENIEDGYLEITPDWSPLFFNQVWLNMIGYSREEYAGMNFRHLVNEEEARQLSQIFEDVYETGMSSRGVELQIMQKGGARINVDISVSLILDSRGKRVGIRNFIRDVTERKKAEETIRRLAYHDPLTGLPNRLLFRDRLSVAITRAKRHQQYLAVMMLDLDKFKDVNDTLGHHMGDLLLQDVGERLIGLLRKGDTIARMGGDEFMLMLPEIKKIEDSTMIAQKIVDAFQNPFIIDDHEIHITTSIGIAIYPDNSDDVDTLVKHADIAMYRAKETGRNNYQQFTSSMVIREIR